MYTHEIHVATPSLLSRCYKRFREDHSEDWKEILETFELVEMTKSHEHTISQRMQTFNAIRRKLCNLASSFHTL